MDIAPQVAFPQTLSPGLSGLFMLAYALGLYFSLKLHRDCFGSSAHADGDEPLLSIGVTLVTLAEVTVLVALVREVCMASIRRETPAYCRCSIFGPGTLELRLHGDKE